jgi:maltooligosyltrehalose trehalohydrolase
MDGLRIDAVHAIVDTSAIHFLEQLAARVRNLEAELGRQMALVVESDRNDPRIILPTEKGGYGIDAQWNEDLHHALQALLTGERKGYYQDFGELADVAKVPTQGFVYDGRYSAYRRRRHGRPVMVACNFTDKRQMIPCPEVQKREVLLSSEEIVVGKKNQIQMPGHSIAVLKV